MSPMHWYTTQSAPELWLSSCQKSSPIFQVSPALVSVVWCLVAFLREDGLIPA